MTVQGVQVIDSLSTWRRTAPAWSVLGVMGAGAWGLTAARADMDPAPGTMGMTFVAFLVMWTAMMAAMMFPAIGPMAARTAVRSAVPARHVLGSIAFAFGFLAPWLAYGAIAFAALAGAERLVDSSPGTAELVGVAILAVAGLYQLLPPKLAALRHCRDGGEGAPSNPAGRLLEGAHDGLVCVGCCWALMAVLIALGVMNLPAMVALAIGIFAEKVLPRPRRVAGVIGVALLVAALVAALDPSMLAGLTTPSAPMDAPMPMPGM